MPDYLRRLQPRFGRFGRQVWAILWRTIVKYNETDGEQRAASFAYYAFFSLFPLLLLLITIGTTLLGDQTQATRVIVGFFGNAIPEGQAQWFAQVVEGVVNSRRSAGIIALSVLLWSAIRFFQALVHGVNKAWGTKEYPWWRIPFQNFFMMGIMASAFFLGNLIPPAINLLEHYFWQGVNEAGLDVRPAVGLFNLARKIVPTLVLFYSFSMFYKFAPRRRTPYREVWFASLLVTLSLEGLQQLFVLYTTNISDLNRLYGTLGSVVALLLWIYLTGSVIILGGCLSAAQYEVALHLTDQSESERARVA